MSDKLQRQKLQLDTERMIKELHDLALTHPGEGFVQAVLSNYGFGESYILMAVSCVGVGEVITRAFNNYANCRVLIGGELLNGIKDLEYEL